MPDEIIPDPKPLPKKPPYGRRCQKGERWGGRTTGTKNKSAEKVLEMLNRLGCDPVEGTARIAMGDVPCGVCHGKGKTKFQPANGHGPGERTCESCWGSKKEKISPELKGQMFINLLKYCYPQLRAMEISGDVNTPDLARVMRERFERQNKTLTLDVPFAPSAEYEQ